MLHMKQLNSKKTHFFSVWQDSFHLAYCRGVWWEYRTTTLLGDHLQRWAIKTIILSFTTYYLFSAILLLVTINGTPIQCHFTKLNPFVFYRHQLKPFSKRYILDSSKLKEFADDNLEFDENVRKFYKRVEITVGKGEIARVEQFLLFRQCFQKACTVDT